MSPADAELLAKIESFDIDGPNPPALRFAARLAREHGWPLAYAERAVREYKRFVFLCLTAGRSCCPSEDVDAVWHQHLTYTRSYWKRFCGDTLGTPLHHDPTRGGPAEHDKHLRMYAETLAAYRRAFGHEPPADLWPPAATRFGDDLRHEVVNTRRNWVIPKRPVVRGLAGLAAAALVVVGLAGADGNPFDLVGTAYLGFLIPVMIAAVVLGVWVKRRRLGTGYQDGEEPPALSWEQAAYLAGGYRRLTTAALARLVQHGHAAVSTDDKTVQATGAPGVTPGGLSTAERAAFAQLPLRKDDPAGMKALAQRVQQDWADDARRLDEAGLTLAPDRAKAVGCVAALPLALVIAVFGLTRLLFGLAGDKPVGFLFGTLVVGGVVALILAARRPLRTRKGDEALARLKTDHGLLKRAKTWEPAADVGLAVALFGTAALAGSELDRLNRWYPKTTGEAGGGDGGCGAGCGGADGGGGCGGGGGDGGGGGCGGCGGGGGD